MLTIETIQTDLYDNTPEEIEAWLHQNGIEQFVLEEDTPEEWIIKFVPELDPAKADRIIFDLFPGHYGWYLGYNCYKLHIVKGYDTEVKSPPGYVQLDKFFIAMLEQEEPDSETTRLLEKAQEVIRLANIAATSEDQDAIADIAELLRVRL